MAKASVRVAQIGQLAVNRPVFQLQSLSGRFVFVANESGRAVFKPASYLQELGVSSKVTANYSQGIDMVTSLTLELDGVKSCEVSKCFLATYDLGSGLAFVPDFSPVDGWNGIRPGIEITYEL